MYLIGPVNFTDEVLQADQPFLLLCMPCDDDFPGQRKLMEDASKHYGQQLKTGMLTEEFTESFKKKFDIHGTPTFLIFWSGNEANRMLGLADFRTLESFIRETIQQTVTTAPNGNTSGYRQEA